MATDVVAAIDGLGWTGTPLVGIGHSMGAAALLLAEQDSPGLFSSVTLFEPIVFPAHLVTDPGENPLAAGARRRREHFESRAAARENYAAKPPMASFTAEALDGYVMGGLTADGAGTGVRLCCSPEREAACYEMGTRHGAYERLADVRCPSIVMCGIDGGYPATVAPLVADALPKGRLIQLGDMGHFGPFERPSRIAEMVLADPPLND